MGALAIARVNMSDKTIFRVVISASDRGALIAALHEHDVHPTGPLRAGRAVAGGVGDGSSVDAYVTQDRIDQLKKSGITTDVIEDASATGRARQKEVGTGNRFEGNRLPQGLGRTVKDGDVLP